MQLLLTNLLLPLITLLAITTALPAPRCRLGETWDPDTRSCILDPDVPSCPPGQEWNFITRRCVKKPCPDGHVRNDAGTCLRIPCPTGQVRNDAGTCVPRTCQPGFQVDGTTGLCAPVPPPPPPPCAEGFARNKDGVCVDRRPCPMLLERDWNGKCVPRTFTCRIPGCALDEPCPPGKVRLGKNGPCIKRCPFPGHGSC